MQHLSHYLCGGKKKIQGVDYRMSVLSSNLFYIPCSSSLGVSNLAYITPGTLVQKSN